MQEYTAEKPITVKELSAIALTVLHDQYPEHSVLFYTNLKDVIYVFMKKDSVSLSGITDTETLTIVLPVHDFDLHIADNYSSLNYKEKTKGFFPQFNYIEYPKKSNQPYKDFAEAVGSKFGPILQSYSAFVLEAIEVDDIVY